MQPITSIGITEKTGLTCAGEDLAASDSGLYLDQLPGLGHEWFAPDGTYGSCTEPKSYLSRLVGARKEALSLVNEAVIKGLTSTYPLQKHTFQGYVGQRQGIGQAQHTQLIIQSAKYTDAFLVISHIGVVATGEGTATITLSYPEGGTQTFEIPVEQSGYNGIPATLKLPLNGSEYTFDVATTGTVKLQNNGIGCGCGAKDTMMYGYLQFNSKAYAAGISLTAAIKCDVQDVVDRAYTNDSILQEVFARMLYYRAGVVLCDYILGDVTPQEYDTDLKYVVAKRANLMEEFQENRLEWVIESGIDAKTSACFACAGARTVSLG